MLSVPPSRSTVPTLPPLLFIIMNVHPLQLRAAPVFVMLIPAPESRMYVPGSRLIVPLMFISVLKHFTPVELLQAMKSLVAWGVRSVVVGNIGGGTVERRYSDAAPKIRDGSIKTAVELFNELSAIVPSDDEFKTSFTMARVTRAKLARYYLGALERAAADTDEPELVPNADAEKVNLEHILPKNATAAEWPAFTREQREDLLHRLGNMALLAKGPNDRIGNRPFLAKKPVLIASSLLLTKDAGAQPEWTPIAIHERQERLAHSAVSVWKRSP